MVRNQKGRFVKGSKKPITKEEREKVISLYNQERKSKNEIVSILSMGYNKVTRILLEGNVTLRKRMGSTIEQEYGEERAKEIKNKWLEKMKVNWKNPEYNKRVGNSIRNSEKHKKVMQSKKYRENMSKLKSGENNGFYGKHHSEETRRILEDRVYSKNRNKTFEERYGLEKAKEIEKKRKEAIHKFYLNPKNVKRVGSKISKTKLKLISEGKLNPMKGMVRHSKPEQILKDIIEKNNLSFNYTGDGSIWFKGENHNFNPDFLSKNPKHIIEVFGDYWHSREDIKKKDQERFETYSKYGYKTLVLWEHELINRRGIRLNPNGVINKIEQFIKGNTTLIPYLNGNFVRRM